MQLPAQRATCDFAQASRALSKMPDLEVFRLSLRTGDEVTNDSRQSELAYAHLNNLTTLELVRTPLPSIHPLLHVEAPPPTSSTMAQIIS